MTIRIPTPEQLLKAATRRVAEAIAPEKFTMESGAKTKKAALKATKA